MELRIDTIEDIWETAGRGGPGCSEKSYAFQPQDEDSENVDKTSRDH